MLKIGAGILIVIGQGEWGRRRGRRIGGEWGGAGEWGRR